MPARPLNRICYVEDDEDIQRIVRLSLERIGKMTVEVVSEDRKSTRLNSSHSQQSRMPSSA